MVHDDATDDEVCSDMKAEAGAYGIGAYNDTVFVCLFLLLVFSLLFLCQWKNIYRLPKYTIHIKTQSLW